MDREKEIHWIGSSYKDLLKFEVEARREAGFQLRNIQVGLPPEDWKPMGIVGPGVNELRIQVASGIYRILYLDKLPEAVYVLHCFQKKSQKTRKKDIQIARVRYQALITQR